MVAGIPHALMEKVESESWADYQLAGSAVPAARQLRIGGGIALVVSDDAGGSWNRASGVGWEEPVTAGLVEQIIGFYREQGATSARLMIAPQVLPPDWAALRERFNIGDGGSAVVKLSGDTCTVVAQSKAADRLDRGLRVGSVPGARAREWGRAMQQGFERDDSRTAEIAAGLARVPAWQTFAAFEGDSIVSAGSLHIVGNVGHLFAASTLPRARNRGAQCALIAARALAAQEAGCTWLISESSAEEPGQYNPSPHNQLRTELTNRYHRRNWVWRDPADRGGTIFPTASRLWFGVGCARGNPGPQRLDD